MNRKKKKKRTQSRQVCMKYKQKAAGTSIFPFLMAMVGPLGQH